MPACSIEEGHPLGSLGSTTPHELQPLPPNIPKPENYVTIDAYESTIEGIFAVDISIPPSESGIALPAQQITWPNLHLTNVRSAIDAIIYVVPPSLPLPLTDLDKPRRAMMHISDLGGSTIVEVVRGPVLNWTLST